MQGCKLARDLPMYLSMYLSMYAVREPSDQCSRQFVFGSVRATFLRTPTLWRSDELTKEGVAGTELSELSASSSAREQWKRLSDLRLFCDLLDLHQSRPCSPCSLRRRHCTWRR